MTVFRPRQFGKYQLLDKIAVGGMAELFRAKLTGAQGFEKLIAIKKILPHLSLEENLVKAFIDEAKLAALLHHENIVQIYDFGSMDGEYFIAMEYLFGKDLRTIIQMAVKKDLPLGLENTFYIASRICAGLDYSHNLKDLQGKPLNIIHRDINPQNILITYGGQVKIIDFGIAKAAGHNTKTKENLIKGKLAYMSPEQASGRTIDHRSDIFSTGIILYELLAGRRMFKGETMHVLSLVQEAQFDAPEDVIPDLPRGMHDILRRALAKEPENRYQSCGEMLAALEECAFELSLRPNSRSFDRYMKELFEEEFAEEELALWANTQTDKAGEPDSGEDSEQEDTTYEQTAVLTKIPAAATLKKLEKLFSTAKLRQLNKSFSTAKLRQLKKSFSPAKLKRLDYKTVALILALVLLAVLVDLGLRRMPFTGSHEEVSASPARSTTAKESAEFTRLAAAKAALQQKRFAQAATIFEEILASQPSMSKRIAEFYAQALEGEASELVETDPDQAETLLLKALKIDPDNISGLSRLGYIYIAQKNYPKAIETYQKVTELAPRLPDAFFNLGYVYAITEKYQKARVMYSRVVEMAPPFADEALFNLAVIYDKLGERDLCIKNLKQAVLLNPANESARNYLDQLKRQAGDRG